MDSSNTKVSDNLRKISQKQSESGMDGATGGREGSGNPMTEINEMFTKIMQETSSTRQEFATVKKSLNDQLSELSKNSNSGFQENHEAIS